MRKLVGVSVLLLTVNLFATSVFAQQVPTIIWGMPWPQYFSQLLGVPEEWLEWPQVFWLLILPYIATLAIVYGIFEEIGILRRAPHRSTIYGIIAVAWALMLIPTGFLGTIAATLYTIGAMWSVIIFLVLFFGGSALLVRTRFGKYGREAWSAEMGMTKAKWEQIKALEAEVTNLKNQYEDAIKKGHHNVARELSERIDKLKAEIKDLQRL